MLRFILHKNVACFRKIWRYYSRKVIGTNKNAAYSSCYRPLDTLKFKGTADNSASPYLFCMHFSSNFHRISDSSRMLQILVVL